MSAMVDPGSHIAYEIDSVSSFKLEETISSQILGLEFRQSQKIRLNGERFPDTISPLKTFVRESHPFPPDELLTLVWRYQDSDYQQGKKLSLPLCFSNTSDRFEVREVSFDGAMDIQCATEPASEDSQDRVCHVQLNAASFASELSVQKGRFDYQCTVDIVQKKRGSISGELLVFSYLIKPELFANNAQKNATSGAPEQGKSGRSNRLSGSEGGGFSGGMGGDDYRKPRKKGGGAAFPDIDLLVYLPEQNADQESADQESADQESADQESDDTEHLMGDVQWQSTAGQTDVTIHYHFMGQRQSQRISRSQWNNLVKKGLHRNSGALFHFLLARQKKYEAILDLLGLSEEPMLFEGSEVDDSSFSDIIKELEWEIPQELSVAVVMSDIYEDMLTERLGDPLRMAERLSYASEAEYLSALQHLLGLISNYEEIGSHCALSDSSNVSMAENPDTIDLKGLIAHYEGCLTRVRKEYLTALLKAFFQSAESKGQYPVSWNEGKGGKGGGKSTPQPKEDKASSDQARKQDGLTSSDSDSVEEAGGSAGEQDERAQPPDKSGAEPGSVEASKLRRIVNERIDVDSSCQPLLIERDAAARIEAVLNFGESEAEFSTALKQFLVKAANQPWDSPLYRAPDVDKLLATGVLKKGVIVAIFWSQNLPLEHPVLQRIQGAELIYRSLTKGGFKPINDLLTGFTYSKHLQGSINYARATFSVEPAVRESLQSNFKIGDDHSPFLRASHIHDQLGDESHLSGESSAARIAEGLLGVFVSINPYLTEEVAFVQHRSQISPNASVSRAQKAASPESVDSKVLSTNKKTVLSNAVTQAAAEADKQLADKKWRREASHQVLIETVRKALKTSGVFSGVKVLRVIGNSGFGVVFEVEDGGHKYALKYSSIPDGYMTTFLQSYRIISTLGRDSEFRNVVLKHELSQSKKRLIQSMTLMDSTLDKPLGTDRRDGKTFWNHYFIQIVHQLTVLNRKGIFHRDLKPDNIGIKDGVVYLLDLDTLYQDRGTPNARGVFQSLVAAPEFHNAQYQQKAIHVYNGPVEGQSDEITSLAHVWFYVRLNNSLSSVHLKYLQESEAVPEQYEKQMAAGHQKYARSLLMNEMLEDLKADQGLVKLLFERRQVEFGDLDRFAFERFILKRAEESDLKEFVHKLSKANGFTDEAQQLMPKLWPDNDEVGSEHPVLIVRPSKPVSGSGSGTRAKASSDRKATAVEKLHQELASSLENERVSPEQLIGWFLQQDMNIESTATTIREVIADVSMYTSDDQMAEYIARIKADRLSPSLTCASDQRPLVSESANWGQFCMGCNQPFNAGEKIYACKHHLQSDNYSASFHKQCISTPQKVGI